MPSVVPSPVPRSNASASLSVDVQHHTIKSVIADVIEREMEGGWEEDYDGFLRAVPKARVEEDCIVSDPSVLSDWPLTRPLRQDCYKWEFGEFKKGKKKDPALSS